ncbi:MAG: iron-sulfur cluster assembly protein, partial [Gemmatimonadota bacterium]|nr:iron-sulfur cluster assembly protein [Gemmatimonadota bacterium]
PQSPESPESPERLRNPQNPELPASVSPPATPLLTQPANTATQSPAQRPNPDPGTRAETGPAGERPGVVSEDQVKLGLRRVKDPDLQLNIMDLGLVYGIRVDGAVVSVDMTLTSPGCPSGPEIMGDAERELRTLPGVEDVKVNLVWAPFWTPDRIEPRVRAYLGL